MHIFVQIPFICGSFYVSKISGPGAQNDDHSELGSHGNVYAAAGNITYQPCSLLVMYAITADRPG